MTTKERNLLLTNCFIIALLFAIRISVAGWVLIAIGIWIILPLFIFHVISSNKGFKRYSILNRNDKFTLWLSFISFIIFILFQYDLDDKAGYMVIEGLVNSLTNSRNESDFSTASTIITVISGIVFIISDIYILAKLKKIYKNNNAKK